MIFEAPFSADSGQNQSKKKVQGGLLVFRGRAVNLFTVPAKENEFIASVTLKSKDKRVA